MALLRPKSERRKSRIGRRPSTILECPYNGHQVSWCRHLCEPIDGFGHCGRLSTHEMLGRTQVAILNYSARKAGPLRTPPGSVD